MSLCYIHWYFIDKATGLQTGFNYHSVMTQKGKVVGLPANVLPLRHLSHYGAVKLMDFLSVQRIEM